MAAWCVRRSMRPTAHEALGKMVCQSRKAKFVVRTIDFCS
jgi:hypothetical protein